MLDTLVVLWVVAVMSRVARLARHLHTAVAALREVHEDSVRAVH